MRRSVVVSTALNAADANRPMAKQASARRATRPALAAPAADAIPVTSSANTSGTIVIRSPSSHAVPRNVMTGRAGDHDLRKSARQDATQGKPGDQGHEYARC